MNEQLHCLPGAPHAGDVTIRSPEAADATPLRAERLGAAQMALHGRQLAARHPPPRQTGDGAALLARLADNAAVIAGACALLARHASAAGAPAAEALLDHHALIDEHIRHARHQLPRRACRALPCLAAAGAALPRIWCLALEAVAHGDGCLEHESLARFVAGYQEGAPLALAELQALPAVLRLALVENLRRLAVRLAHAHQQRDLAREWAARMEATAAARPGDLVLLMADLAREVPALDAAFVAELAQRLEGRDGALDVVLHWLATRLADEGATLAQQVALDRTDTDADAASLANSIASLRLLATIDWSAFLEAASGIEAALRTDPAAVYPRMDGASRALYRAAVARLAHESGRAETEVAAEALALAAGAGADARAGHVGHYLIGDGLPALRASLGQRPGWQAALRGAARRRPLRAWLGATAAFTLLFVLALLVHAWRGGAGATLLVLLGLLAACGASELALALTTRMAARLVAPRALPRMDFSGGIPDHCRSLLVVPALLESRAGLDALCRRLELHYLANREAQLRFGLLLDLADAPSETLAADAALLEQAASAVAALNARHGERFLLLVRRRSWHSGERAWIGRERKRGALADLCALLRGGARAPFALAAGNTADLGGLRYLIALDADTRLAPGSARRMVAAMAHPLTRPVLAADGRSVIAGHGFLQARVVRSLPVEGSSRYARLCGGEPGIELQPRPPANVHQDLFGRGALGDQGIYEVDACARVLAGLPEESVPAHALLASSLLAGGLLGDVQLCQAAPARYRDDAARRARRVRGDWQLAGWLRARVRVADGRRSANPLAPLARWKLFDRLRRSLVAPTLTGMLVLCWARLPSPAFWTAAALSVFFLPAFIDMLIELADRPHDAPWRQHGANWAQGARLALRRAAMRAVVLPHQAWLHLDAIARAGWRLLVSRRGLLAAAPAARPRTEIEHNVRQMWFALALPACVAVLLTFLHPLALFAAAPLLLLWFLSPVIAWWVSLPGERGAPALAEGHKLFLGAVARRHWAYFETFAGPQDNWLPPDSMQEHPHARITHRTSPTDIGIGLLANLAAWDFGFVSQAEVLARVRAAFDSMALLERHRGHFCHWYDTQTLAPLQPALVSTRDSGNLAAHLLTLAAGLEGLADAPIADGRALAGMRATLQVLQDCADKEQAHAPALRAALEQAWRALRPEAARKADTLPDLADCLAGALRAAANIVHALPDEAGAALREWSARFEADCRALHEDLLALAPWMQAAQEYVLEASLTRIPTLRELAAYAMPEGAGSAERALAALVGAGAAAARARLDEIGELARRARAFADMDFGLLYRPASGLLASGYDASEDTLLPGDCALLASEARLASFVGIARGQLPPEHWCALQRPLGLVQGEQLLLSQDGALSDYLAPQLVMPSCRGSLLDRSAAALVRVQVLHGDRHRVPWGMSESGFNSVDAAMNYAYRGFGAPGTGLARGSGEELVVAPHAALLALPVAPTEALANLERMAGLDWIGEYGFYEAVDYTAARLPRPRKHALVRAFMAHHQGMGLLALSQLLHARPMQARFEADPELAAALPLLYERMPKTGAFDPVRTAAPAVLAAAGAPRVVDGAGGAPEVQLLSNGRYHVMLASDGAGYSRWDELDITRWQGDAAGGDGGLCCYLRDLDSGAVWSAGLRPTLAQAAHYEAVFAEGRAELRRVDDGIELVTEIVVAPGDDVELRRMRIRNGSGAPRRIELTSCVEPAPAGADSGWQTEIVAGQGALLCTPEPPAGTSGASDTHWLLHVLAVHAGGVGTASFETERRRFIGVPGADLLPAALHAPGPLASAGGPAAEPLLAIRRVLALAPGEEASVDLVLGVAPARAQALALAERYGQRQEADAAVELAWSEAQALLRQLDIAEHDAGLYARLAGALLYPLRALRADPALIERNRLGQDALRRYGISGALPLVLVQLRDAAGLGLARELVQAHVYWGRKGLAADLVIWAPDALQPQVARLLAAGDGSGPGGLFAFVPDGLVEEDRVLMQAVARVVLHDRRGSLLDQLRRAAAAAPQPDPPPLRPAPGPRAWSAPAPRTAPPAPLLDDGSAGFSADGSEYLVRLAPGRPAPAPWPQLLANPSFGASLSEGGEASAWRGDGLPLAGAEAYYLRDEDSGAFWSPAALPAPSGAACLARHGFGYSVFEHTAHGIRSEMTSFVGLEAPLKYTMLKVRNDSSAARRLSLTGYVEWTLGAQRAQLAPHVVTARDPDSGALLARTAWHGDADGAAFFHVDGAASFTCDRMEFIGRDGGPGKPRALGRTNLAGTCGAGFDPCAALQVAFELQPGEQKQYVFLLGAGPVDGIARLVHAHGDAAAALAGVRAWWRATVGALRIDTPDPALDLLANGWLVYRAIVAGIRAGGASWRFGERLQQAMALVHHRPQLLREQLLLCAAHQFVEDAAGQGDGAARAVRMRAAGDLLWLPLAACRYLAATGDAGVLDEPVPWLEERALVAGEAVHGDLYAHCVRAIRHALQVGTHGLPLADEAGRAESVWLGFFMIEVLRRFAEVAQSRADYGFATTCRAASLALAARLAEHAWDGELYRASLDGPRPAPDRAAPVDLAVQAWAVLSDAASPGRAACALAAADAELVRRGSDAAAPLERIWIAMALARLGQGERAWQLLDAMQPLRQADAAAAAVVGRPGANWYTCAAGPLYRLIVESLLGVERIGQQLVLAPQLPQDWPGFRLEYRYRDTVYAIEVRAAEADVLLVDGERVSGNAVHLVDDGATHRVELHVARRQGPAVSAEQEENQSKTIP